MHCVLYLGKTLHEIGHNGLASHPGGSREYYSGLLHATETGISYGLMGLLAHMQTLPF